MFTRQAMLVAPHHLAAEAGAQVLGEGGNAIEAMVAAAAAIAVVYPHMNSIGGDGFWLMAAPGSPPTAIEGCGRAAAAVDAATYRERGHANIPFRGSTAAITVAGTVSGWAAALELSAQRWGGRLPLARLLAPAIALARDGFGISASQCEATRTKRLELESLTGFGTTFLSGGHPPEPGTRFRQPILADTLDRLVRAGLDDFYRGDVARAIAADLASTGSPLRRTDLEAHRALEVEPLRLQLPVGEVYNLPPPTQGLASLMILGLYERVRRSAGDGEAALVHALVEATKLAFDVRNREVADLDRMTVEPAGFLTAATLDRLASGFDPDRAAPWPRGGDPADTVWLGAIDGEGRSASFIQSLYHEFGSGIVLPATGICWQNRGCAFSLDPAARNALAPGRRPFHTLNPAMARLNDGRTLVYGAMGGDGQPQSQAAVFTRHVYHGLDLAAAIDAPRWLLGRTWGSDSDTLKLESRFPPPVVDQLRALGHEIEILEPYSETMGHAGAIVRSASGDVTGSSDPRCDGAALGPGD